MLKNDPIPARTPRATEADSLAGLELPMLIFNEVFAAFALAESEDVRADGRHASAALA